MLPFFGPPRRCLFPYYYPSCSFSRSAQSRCVSISEHTDKCKLNKASLRFPVFYKHQSYSPQLGNEYFLSAFHRVYESPRARTRTHSLCKAAPHTHHSIMTRNLSTVISFSRSKDCVSIMFQTHLKKTTFWIHFMNLLFFSLFYPCLILPRDVPWHERMVGRFSEATVLNLSWFTLRVAQTTYTSIANDLTWQLFQ